MISGRSKGKIRPPRRLGISGHGHDEFETQWDILSSALREIHTKNASALSFEQIYRASYKIVLKKQGDKLYDRVKEFEEQWFAGEVMPKIRGLITSNLVNITLGGVSGIAANERRITGEEFLQGLKAAWEDHIMTMNMTTDVLMYMDRVYCTDNRKPSIFTTSMGLFRDNVLRSRLIDTGEADLVTFNILNSVLLDQIGMERDGDVISPSMIRACVYMLEGLYESNDETEGDKLYVTTFEVAFLDHARAFYQKECATLLRESDTSTWLRQTKKRLAEEEARCQTTISMLTAPKIAKVVEAEMISAHVTEFLAMEGSGIKAMIEDNRYEDLTLLYTLISRVDPSKALLKLALQSRIVELGCQINKNITDSESAPSFAAPVEEADPAEGAEKAKAPKQSAASRQTAAAIRWVEEVLVLKEKFESMHKICLAEDLILHSAITQSFSEFINMFPRCSEYVSLFIDDNLKRGIKGKTETEIEVVLDKATTLLRYIQDKDMFELYYKKHLARRLLHGKSESADVEKQMISRMKLEIGNSFTTKLEGMFKDMTMSEELCAGYRTHIQGLGDIDRKQIDLGINVLTSNYWPMEGLGGKSSQREDGTYSSVTWPSEIQTLQESFKKYYLKNRNGRALTWLSYLGNADIKCVFPKIPGKDAGPLARERKHELNVPTYGMIILLLFNDLADGQSLSYEDIQQTTNIPDHDLVRMLHTLAVNPKAKVLTKNPDNKHIPKPGDTFTFNAKFTSKTIKIKAPVMLNVVNRAEDEAERKATEESNNEHRGNIIDTVIVRIMKARKTISHQMLFAEVISQLSQRFKPDIGMMKRRVESLIEREYMERVETAAVPTYNYVA
ncbi:uncharacterized protein L3040_006340 [Drepanopeziza brunnea f. sp. 'multigermtubi']|uniref:uncharacterized protein n=1 Tax=Drepanopeziza brunnea f. sp. 'multigermtubi' TaxID=698441 RepID=UPI00239D7060|nr:hypothetical protein L3040_006340 [Drepanopeziza brunnea f. sp. 'multigermtubi']